MSFIALSEVGGAFRGGRCTDMLMGGFTRRRRKAWVHDGGGGGVKNVPMLYCTWASRWESTHSGGAPNVLGGSNHRCPPGRFACLRVRGWRPSHHPSVDEWVRRDSGKPRAAPGGIGMAGDPPVSQRTEWPCIQDWIDSSLSTGRGAWLDGQT